MDTPCIPSEPKLRWECIQNITRIFSTSRRTLVCDRDLMSIDISNTAIDACEAILAVLLVCDWSLRAWTLLEAIRGHELYILCKEDQIIELVDAITLVRQAGRIELPLLYGNRDYLLQHPDINLLAQESDLFDIGDTRVIPLDLELTRGFIGIGEAAELLSHRHPTRDGDDLLIWSLLIGDLEAADAETLWKRQIGTDIHVGSLISSAPRLKCFGLSWAPSRPFLRSTTETPGGGPRVYEPFEGGNTIKGQITPEGLSARWLIFQFQAAEYMGVRSRANSVEDPKFHERMQTIGNQHLAGYTWGVLLATGPRGSLNAARIVSPKCEGQLLVICASHNGDSWEWRDIYEWDNQVPLPRFESKVILIT
ncbi:MAG: hypothetical protein Q9160_003119 [Pyrenula sp. 1 TL-2023]